MPGTVPAAAVTTPQCDSTGRSGDGIASSHNRGPGRPCPHAAATSVVWAARDGRGGADIPSRAGAGAARADSAGHGKCFRNFRKIDSFSLHETRQVFSHFLNGIKISHSDSSTKIPHPQARHTAQNERYIACGSTGQGSTGRRSMRQCVNVSMRQWANDQYSKT